MPLKTTLLLLLVIVIWGSNFVAIKIGVQEIEPLMLLALRFGVAGLIFLPFMKWPGWHKATFIVSVGILMGLLHQGLLYVGMKFMPAGEMSILLQFNVILITLISWLFLKETIGWRTWLGIITGIIGIIILVGKPDFTGQGIGYLYGFASTVFIAIAYIMMKKMDEVHPQTYIALLHLPVAPMIFASSLVFEGTEWMTHISDLNWTKISMVILYQAVILSGTHIIWQRLLVRYPVSHVIPWTLLIPISGVGIGILALGEQLTLSIIWGGFLTILGVAIVTFRRIEKKYPLNTID